MRHYFKLLQWFSKKNPYQFIFSDNLINLDEFNKIKELTWNIQYKRVMFWFNIIMCAFHGIIMLFAIYNIDLYGALVRSGFVLFHCVIIGVDYRSELYDMMLGYYKGLRAKNISWWNSGEEEHDIYQEEVNIIASIMRMFVSTCTGRRDIIDEDIVKSIYCLNTSRGVYE